MRPSSETHYASGLGPDFVTQPLQIQQRTTNELFADHGSFNDPLDIKPTLETDFSA
jgi:hypothetical protein